MASLMASQAFFSQTLTLTRPPTPSPTLKPFSSPSPPPFLHLNPSTPNLRRPLSVSAATHSPPPLSTAPTRTLTTLFAVTLAAFRAASLPVVTFASQSLPALASSAGPLFFAALNDRPSGYLNTPLTVVAAGLSKWLDIYSGVLMVRVLLSWFPNIPWDRQPLSAIRDLCDPYLNLFRNIIPPIFDTLDVSPLLAFAVLGTLGSILNNSRGMY
ncbi:ylmG homolog protein 1-2, chloroplastic-like [Argentina anserina]|uniref:ylmG homolog protein 1-2, chloroplastic-like n=1 Tax=Argentina anserina TaxID=57926 RepID=UPI00217646BE|nr:ylmG homolog protein 1-2, chloroplastic-like [Potentilla anserina]